MPGSLGSKVAHVGKTASTAPGPALNFRTVFFIGLAAGLSYATALLVVVYFYRRGYGTSGKPDYRLRSMAKSSPRLCSRTRAQMTLAAMVSITR